MTATTTDRHAEFLALSRQLGLSVPQTAALCGVGLRIVSYWRSGRHAVPLSVLLVLRAEAEKRARETATP